VHASDVTVSACCCTVCSVYVRRVLSFRA
jgi:hypothetical protein